MTKMLKTAQSNINLRICSGPVVDENDLKWVAKEEKKMLLL